MSLYASLYTHSITDSLFNPPSVDRYIHVYIICLCMLAYILILSLFNSLSVGGIPRRNLSFHTRDVNQKPIIQMRHNGYRDMSDEPEDALDEYHQ